MGLSHTQGHGWWHGLILQRDRMEELFAASMPAVFVSVQLLPLSLRIQYECPRRVASAIVFGNFQPMRLQSLNSLPLGSIRTINEEKSWRVSSSLHLASILQQPGAFQCLSSGEKSSNLFWQVRSSNHSYNVIIYNPFCQINYSQITLSGQLQLGNQ